MNYSRQLNLLNPANYHGHSATVIGAGATGASVAMQLAQHGFGDPEFGGVLKVFDGDIIEEHNLPNQIFFLDQIGSNKADALNDLIEKKMGFRINSYPQMVTSDTPKGLVASEVVFLMTDTMSSRKELFEKFLKYNPAVQLVVETRMGLKSGLIHAFNPCDQKQVAIWEKTLFSDGDIETETACGGSQTAITTAMRIAAIGASRWVQYMMQLMSNYTISNARKMWNEMHVFMYSDEFVITDWENPAESQTTRTFNLI